jgi:chromosomal replication initiation ATPase DnaA
MNPRIQKIIDLTSFYFGIPVEKVMGKIKKNNYVIPRHVSILLANEFVLTSKRGLANEIGVNHSFVYYAIEACENNHELIPHLDYLRHKITKELDLQLSEKIEEINAA